jgi:hypothetical protein
MRELQPTNPIMSYGEQILRMAMHRENRAHCVPMYTATELLPFIARSGRCFYIKLYVEAFVTSPRLAGSLATETKNDMF